MNKNTPYRLRQLQEKPINHTKNNFDFFKETLPYKQ